MSVENRNDFSPRTSLGQNFLVNRDIVRRTVEQAKVKDDDVILEIGPGQGILTREILASPCRHVHAVEIDRRLEPFLEDVLSNPKFSIHWGDGVTFPYRELNPVPTKVIANIPYHVTTPLIWALLESLAPNVDYMILMVQKEAADRLVAPKGTKDRYPLGITLEAMGRAKIYMKVSPGSFRPVPRVSSALVELEINGRPDLPRNGLWRNVLKLSFSQRRKTLSNNLKALGKSKDTVESWLSASIIPKSARAEDLSLEQWLALLETLERDS